MPAPIVRRDGKKAKILYIEDFEIRRVWRQVPHAGAYRSNRLLHASNFVNRNIVHGDDVIASEFRYKTLFDVSEEHCPIHCALKDERRNHTAIAQASNESEHFPISKWSVAE